MTTATSGAAGCRRLAVLVGGIVVAVGCSRAVVAASAQPAVRDGIASFVPQGMKLTGSGESGAGALGGGFRDSLAVSATALPGAPHDAGGNGTLRAFTRTGNAWSRQGGALTGANEAGAGLLGQITAVSPPHLAAGTVEVTVGTAHGTSAASSASSFAYQRPKAVG